MKTTYQKWVEAVNNGKAMAIEHKTVVYIVFHHAYGFTHSLTKGLGDSYYASVSKDGVVSVNRPTAKKLGQLWERGK